MKKIFALFILLFSALNVFAVDIDFHPYPSGHNVYARIWNDEGLILNRTVSGFRTWNDANVAECNYPLTDFGGDKYGRSMPSEVTDAGTYSIDIFLLDEEPPTITDTAIGGGEIAWTGSAVYNPAADSNTAAANSAAIMAKTNLIPDSPASTGQLQPAAEAALAAYDPPTKAEMDSNFTVTNDKIDDVNSNLSTLAEQINDWWLSSGSGGFP